ATGEPRLVSDIPPDHLNARFPPEAREIAASFRLKSYIFAALKAHGKTLGLISLVRYGAHAKPLDQDDLALARSLADHAALAISNSRLLAETNRATERLRLLSELAS